MRAVDKEVLERTRDWLPVTQTWLVLLCRLLAPRFGADNHMVAQLEATNIRHLRCMRAAEDMGGGSGARRLIKRYEEHVVEVSVDDTVIHRDIDVPADPKHG